MRVMVNEHPVRLIVAFGMLGAARVYDAAFGVMATIDAADAMARPLRVAGLARSADVAAEIQSMRLALEDASRLVPGARCLHRAAVGRVWLATKGISASIVVGVRRDDRWQGHAWLEVEDGDARHVVFAEEVPFRPVWRRGD